MINIYTIRKICSSLLAGEITQIPGQGRVIWNNLRHCQHESACDGNSNKPFWDQAHRRFDFQNHPEGKDVSLTIGNSAEFFQKKRLRNLVLCDLFYMCGRRTCPTTKTLSFYRGPPQA